MSSPTRPNETDTSTLGVVRKFTHRWGTNRDWFTISAVVPAVVILSILAIFPILYAVYLSLFDASLLSLEMNWVGLDNYFELYNRPQFLDSVYRGVVFTVGSVAFQLVLGLGLALLLNQHFFGDSTIRTLALFPYLVPTLAVALMWKWLLNVNYGIVNYYLVSFGITDQPVSFFGSLTWSMPMLIIANSWKFTSFVVIILLARLQAIDASLYQQAKVCGASTYQMFRDITLPNLRSAILLVVLLRGIWMFNKFDIVYLLTGGGPLRTTTTLPVYIYQITFNRYELAIGSAAALHLFALLAVGASFYFWYFKPGEEIETRK